MRLRTAFVLAAVCVLLLAGTISAYGADVTVDCNKKKTINGALATLNKQGPNTIHVRGTCNEAVVIDGFDNLTLLASPGATINDPTPSVIDDNYGIDIENSRFVTIQGFTVNGGFRGISCFLSMCYLRELTVQASQDGVLFNRSSGVVDNTTIQNTTFSGLNLYNGSEVLFTSGLFAPGTATIQNNGTAENGSVGVIVAHGSALNLFKVTVQNNLYGDGVRVIFGSDLRIGNSTISGNGGNGVAVRNSALRLERRNTITGNGGNGVILVESSSMQIDEPATITGNGQNGVRVRYLSYLRMNNTGATNISGNAAPDVNCTSVTAVTEGTGGSGSPNLGGGTTNCTEPAP